MTIFFVVVSYPWDFQSRRDFHSSCSNENKSSECTDEFLPTSSLSLMSIVFDASTQDRLVALAKSIASVTAGLVMAAKDVSTHCDNPTDQNRIIGSATQCAMSASQLVTCTKIVVPTLAWSADCQEQVADAAKQVAGHVDNVVQVAQVRC